MDAALRDGIFVGYRSHTGGKWTEQYLVIDFDAYTKIPAKSGRKAYVHAVSEIYVPGSAGDDRDVHPTFPVADGIIKESEETLEADEESSEEPASVVEDLQTSLEETLISSERDDRYKHPDAYNAGGAESQETDKAEDELPSSDPN